MGGPPKEKVGETYVYCVLGREWWKPTGIPLPSAFVLNLEGPLSESLAEQGGRRVFWNHLHQEPFGQGQVRITWGASSGNSQGKVSGGWMAGSGGGQALGASAGPGACTCGGGAVGKPPKAPRGQGKTPPENDGV